MCPGGFGWLCMKNYGCERGICELVIFGHSSVGL